jgi:hypothetical protein
MYNFVEGDTGSAIQVKCIDTVSSAPINLTGSTVKIRWVTKAKVTKLKNMIILDAPAGIVQYNFDVGELEPPSMSFDVVITDANTKIVTCKDIIQVTVRKHL